ncbi:hypothetical protein BDN67DRAFT_815996 [Paxillus ammoniavirescens]|nr:hypothetical protein BDN67DRAFT_815996 [Paxillus ammoniavirescens]
MEGKILRRRSLWTSSCSRRGDELALVARNDPSRSLKFVCAVRRAGRAGHTKWIHRTDNLRDILPNFPDSCRDVELLALGNYEDPTIQVNRQSFQTLDYHEVL